MSASLAHVATHEAGFPRERLDLFLARLTALSHELGLGIAGEPALFVMEQDDSGRKYSTDAESHLHFV
jgi:hypothetical protein